MRKIVILICCMGAAALLGFVSSILKDARAQGERTSLGQLPLMTPTICPVATQAPPPLVDPVTSPTDLLTQTITVHAYPSEAITVTGESGVFAVHEGDDGWSLPGNVEIRMLWGVTHHLRVYSRVPETVFFPGCVWGAYTLSTDVDANGDPLIIEQISPSMPYHFYMPVFMRTADIQE